MGNFVFGAIMAVLSVIGLNMAAQARDPMIEIVGFLLFFFGVAFCFGLIARATAPRTDLRQEE